MTYIFESGLAHHIEGLIQQKRADGYAYNSEEKLLKRFDTFCVQNYPELTTVTYEMAAKWSEARPGEGDAYHNRRMSMVKVLSEYILSLGQEAYIPNFFCKAYRPVLYIPSKEEVKELLQKMDIRTSHNSEQFRLDRECKILFLLYFCCGLRLSEGRLLKWEHIDLDKGILTVLGSKGNKDRLVYLPQDSLPVLKNYKERQEMLFPGIDWAFPGKDPHKPVSCSGIESSFNRHWAMLPVARTVDKHPTPHCLRHAFVVERFNEWMHQGIDTNTMLPCGLVRYVSEPGRFMNEDILEYQGTYYTLSDTKMPFKADKTVDDDYFILTLYALAMEARNKGITLTGKDVVLGVGLPPADYGQQATSFKKYFLDHAKHGISFKMNGKSVNFYLKDVFVSPQNFAAVMCFKASLLKKYRTVNCIDIGDGTVDLLVIRNGKPDLSVRVSDRSGMAVLRSEISNAIQQNYGIHLDSSDVEQVLMQEETILDEKIILEIQRMAENWLQRIINKLHTHVTDFRTNPAVFLGGGSLLLRKQIENSPEFKYVEFIDDVRANAIGYEKLTTARLRRG